MVKRIKKHDLLPWFLEDHGQLPASYLEHCQKFFDEIKSKAASGQAHKPASSQAIDIMGKYII